MQDAPFIFFASVVVMAVSSRALFIGRFQPFHNGHLSALQEILQSYDEAVIVIGSAQENLTERNPLDTGERVSMIYAVLKARKLAGRVYVVPVPDTPESGLWPARVLSYCPKVGAVFSGNDYVEMLFRRQGLKVLHQKPVAGVSATAVRAKISANDASWADLVPAEVAGFLKETGLDERIRRLANSGSSVG